MATGRNSIGFDLNKDYCKQPKKELKLPTRTIYKNKIYLPKIINDDSKNLLSHVKKESVDLAITFPLLGHT